MAQERIGYYGKFTPTSLDTSAADKMRALAGLGETVASTALAIGKPIAVREGAKKGAIEGAKTGRVDPATGELIAPPEQRKFGYGASAFNTAAESSYLGNVSFELDQSVKSAQEQFPDDIMGYNKLVDASKQGLLSKMPEQYRGSAELVFDKINAKAASSVAKAENAKDLEILSAGIIKGANVASDLASNAAFAGDVVGLADLSTEVTLNIENLVKEGGMSQEAGDKFLESFENRIAIQSKLGEVSRAVLDDAYPIEDRAVNGRAIVEALRDNPDQTLSAEQNQELLNRLDSQVTALEVSIAKNASKLTAEQEEIKSNFKVQVGLKLSDAKTLTNAAEQLYSDGILSADERATYLIKINDASKEEINAAQAKERVANIAGSDQLNAVASVDQTPISQRDVDAYYNEEVMNRLPIDDPDKRSMLQANFVADTRFIPADMAQEITNDLRSEDPERIQNAAETVDRIVKIPGATDKISTQDRAFAAQVSFLAQFKGADIATQEALKQTDPDNAIRIESRTKTIKDNPDDFADSYPSEMVDLYGEGFFKKFGVNEIAQYDLVNDYGKLVETYYKGGMDLNNAKAEAQLDIETNYKKGEFGFMKNPPEDFYAVGGSAEYIREDLYNALTGPTGIFGLQVLKENIILVSDDETSRTASTGKPSYRVMYKDNNGTLNYAVFDGVDEQGNRVQLNRYTPDVPSKEEQAKIIKAQADKELQLASDRRGEYVDIRGTTFGARN